MTTINQLSATDAVNDGDLLVIYKSGQGDARKVAASAVADYVDARAELPSEQVTQYAAPSGTGFTVTVATAPTWLLLTATGAFAAGTIALPDAPADKDSVTVTSTQAVTALSVTSAKTVTGAPTTLAANGFFTMRYEAATGAWYRVG